MLVKDNSYGGWCECLYLEVTKYRVIENTDGKLPNVKLSLCLVTIYLCK